MKEETRAHIKFLEGVSSDIDDLRALSTAIKEDMESTARKDDIVTLKQKIDDLTMKLSLTRDQLGNTFYSIFVE